jgi:hypothetical protein
LSQVVTASSKEYSTYKYSQRKPYTVCQKVLNNPDELIALNPIIKEGVEIGMTLKVPAKNGSSTSSQKKNTL